MKIKLQDLTKNRSETPEVISYQKIRRAVGWLGTLLPFALVIGAYVFSECNMIQPSISHYYYTNTREIFEGTLFAVALFLFSYKGFSQLDSLTSNLAGLFCLGVALFPTDHINGFACSADVVSLFDFKAHATIHLASAALFFITLAFMSLFLFTKSKHSKANQTPEKRKRNIIYRISGIVMLGSVAGIGIYFLALHRKSENQTVFALETLALIAFGVSWLTKGEMLFGDKGSSKNL